MLLRNNLTNFLIDCTAFVFIGSLAVLFIDSVRNSFTFPFLTFLANSLKIDGALLVIDSIALLFIADAADLFIDSAALLFICIRALLFIDSVNYCFTLRFIDSFTLKAYGALCVLDSGALALDADTAHSFIDI